MRFDHNKIDIFFIVLLLLTVLGLPIGILVYDHYFWREQIPPDAKEFTLTGHTQNGWIFGEVHAIDVISMGLSKQTPLKPVIEVNKGDQVVFKLKSSDVVHGFSLKDFNIFITDGIQPGKSVLVSFVADKTGTFTFSCNAICGDNHQNMQGTLIVRA